MPAHTASRTLVKSAPELWAECSEAASLAKHLGSFGEIRITKLEPETAVAWEGDAVSGAVRLEPSGWGTRVTLTATAAAEIEAEPPKSRAQPAQPAQPEPEPEPEPEEPPAPRPGALARLFSLIRRRPEPPAPADRAPAAALEPREPLEPPEPPKAPIAPQESPASALDAALDSLGRAHHRPYSRA